MYIYLYGYHQDVYIYTLQIYDCIMLSSADLGLELLISILRMTLPSVLVQINFRNVKMNAEPLTPEFVNYQPGWVGHSRVSLFICN